MWGRPPTYATFVRIILEQFVSLASARKTFERTIQACGNSLTARRLLELGEPGLRSIGFSRQKASYALCLAEQIRARKFSVTKLQRLTDREVRLVITAQRGLGNWSADVYLLMALKRPDVFPPGDLALIKGLQELDGGSYESHDSVTRRSEAWAPFRSVAARMVWQLYLFNRGQLKSRRI